MTVRALMVAIAITAILLAFAAYRGREVRERRLAEAREQLHHVAEARRMEVEFLQIAGRATDPGLASYFRTRAGEMRAMAEAKGKFAAEVFERYGVDPGR